MKLKKVIPAIALSALMLCSAACSQNGGADNSATVAETTAEATSEAVSETSQTAEATQAAQETTAPPEKISAENSGIKALLDELKESGFSGIVYAEKDGKPIARYTNGEFTDGSELKFESPMPIGSVSKQFCAAAIMLLQEQGKLSVQDKLDKYYPEYKEGGKMTLHHLLKMESGITNFGENVPFEDFTSFDNTAEQNVDAMLKWVFEQPLNFEPGERYEYSNFNYTILSSIVEKVSGMTYIDFMKENFFEPLGMKNTGSVTELEAAEYPKWAENLSYNRDDFYPPGNQPGISKGAGDIASTAGDMTVWMNALPSGKIISKESFAQMTANKEDEDYGYGLDFNIGDGFGHQGLTGIFNSADYFDPDSKVTVFIASNNPGRTSTMEAFMRLLSLIESI